MAIAVIGPTVRIDLFAYSAIEREPNGQPKPEFCQRIVMGLDGFMRANLKFQEVAEAISRRAAPRENRVDPPASSEALVPDRESSLPNEQSVTSNFP